ncbi:MAG: hypothetical protein B6I24_05130 [Bacteroidetes bacterium 4572_128]|nr:MAG: hypothetical protein B6I24_05130 [Bacteroidetes bacterium 4572_128]
MKEIEEKTITFRFASIENLKEVINIKAIIKDEKFDKWFNYNYKISDKEKNILENLIKKNRLNLSLYSEQKLAIKFIAPILNEVDFNFKDIKDWYGEEINCKLNGFLLKGKPDLMIATGISFPKKPYFFLQEYKRSINPKGNPEYQVLAGMLVAMQLNKKNKIYGGFVIGRIWQFIILEKLENGNYEYFVSYAFDSLKFQDLKQIYINLQAVKFLFCK